ncbi:hypothetical protein Tco_0146637, partial [Tanacetum coccineum]
GASEEPFGRCRVLQKNLLVVVGIENAVMLFRMLVKPRCQDHDRICLQIESISSYQNVMTSESRKMSKSKHHNNSNRTIHLVQDVEQLAGSSASLSPDI